MTKPSKPSKFTMRERREIFELMREFWPETVVVSNKPDEIKTAHPSLNIGFEYSDPNEEKKKMTTFSISNAEN